eukprot:2399017-Pleurochrysis_carterae.AAC.1
MAASLEARDIEGWGWDSKAGTPARDELPKTSNFTRFWRAACDRQFSHRQAGPVATGSKMASVEGQDGKFRELVSARSSRSRRDGTRKMQCRLSTIGHLRLALCNRIQTLKSKDLITAATRGLGMRN